MSQTPSPLTTPTTPTSGGVPSIVRWIKMNWEKTGQLPRGETTREKFIEWVWKQTTIPEIISDAPDLLDLAYKQKIVDCFGSDDSHFQNIVCCYLDVRSSLATKTKSFSDGNLFEKGTKLYYLFMDLCLSVYISTHGKRPCGHNVLVSYWRERIEMFSSMEGVPDYFRTKLLTPILETHFKNKKQEVDEPDESDESDETEHKVEQSDSDIESIEMSDFSSSDSSSDSPIIRKRTRKRVRRVRVDSDSDDYTEKKRVVSSSPRSGWKFAENMAVVSIGLSSGSRKSDVVEYINKLLHMRYSTWRCAIVCLIDGMVEHLGHDFAKSVQAKTVSDMAVEGFTVPGGSVSVVIQRVYWAFLICRLHQNGVKSKHYDRAVKSVKKYRELVNL